jgi:hypothetical protein
MQLLQQQQMLSQKQTQLLKQLKNMQMKMTLTQLIQQVQD